ADPTQLARLDRLQAQEQSSFVGGAQTDWERNKNLGVTGLAQN
ncbi:unnamed protein product, partial [marine sediment metagenome]